jgi:hypothetical protein
MANPISLVDARLQLRIEADDDSRDVDLLGYIEDAVAWVEDYTGHILAEREVTEHVSGFKPVELRAWPIAADAVPGVAYLGADNTPIAIPGARIDVTRRPARVFPGSGLFWTFRNSAQPFTVTVTAGYASPDDVPRNFKRAMLILISAYDADREGGELFQKAETTARKLCRGRRLLRV